jgi:hypothetical protein
VIRPSASVAERLSNVPRIYLASLAIITLIGSALRVRAVFYPLRHDEAYTFLTYGLQPLWTTLSIYNSPANHILHSALVRVAYLVLGNQEWALRMPALVAGILVIPASFAVFAILADYGSAPLAAALVACSHELIAFSANARGYSQASLLALLMIVVAAHLGTRRSAAAWALLVACAVAALYTIPSMLYAVVMVWTWMALEAGADEQRALQYRDIAVAGAVVVALTALLYLPAIMRSGWDALFRNQFVAPLDWPNFSSAFPGSVAVTWFDWHRKMPAAMGWTLSLGFAAFVIGAAVWGRRPSLFGLLVAAVAGIGAVALLQRVAPPSRVWLFLLPVFAGMAATGLGSLVELAGGAAWDEGRAQGQARSRLPTLWAAVIVVVCVWMALPLAGGDAFLADNEARDLPAIADYLRHELRPGDAVLAAPPLEEPLAYYFYRRHLPREYVNAEPKGGRCFVVLDTRYLPQRNTAVGKMVFDDHERARLVLLKKVNASAVYEWAREKPGEAGVTHCATGAAPGPRRQRE